MKNFLHYLAHALVAPLVLQAEAQLPNGTGADKKAFVLKQISTLGDAFLAHHGVPAAVISELTALLPNAIDLAVSLTNHNGGFDATDAQKLVASAHLAQKHDSKEVAAAAQSIADAKAAPAA